MRSLQWLVLLRHPRLARWHWRYNERERIPNPVEPRTAHDKWFWRKVFDKSPDLVQVTDKLGLREWLKDKDVDIAPPRVLWQGSRAEDIPDALLEQGVVIKANHGCATNIFLPEGPKDRAAINAEANGFLKKLHGKRELQWAYSKVTPTLFVEEYIENMSMEFKFYTFGTRIERLIAIYDRFGNPSADIWLPMEDGSFRRSEAAAVVAEGKAEKPLPDIVPASLPIVRKLGSYFDHIRVDFMSDGKKLWLGELTVYNLGGHFRGINREEMERMNAVWDIEASWFMTTPQTGWRAAYQGALKRQLTTAQA